MQRKWERNSKKEKKNLEALLPIVNNDNMVELQTCTVGIISGRHQ